MEVLTQVEDRPCARLTSGVISTASLTHQIHHVNGHTGGDPPDWGLPGVHDHDGDVLQGLIRLAFREGLLIQSVNAVLLSMPRLMVISPDHRESGCSRELSRPPTAACPSVAPDASRTVSTQEPPSSTTNACVVSASPTFIARPPTLLINATPQSNRPDSLAAVPRRCDDGRRPGKHTVIGRRTRLAQVSESRQPATRRYGRSGCCSIRREDGSRTPPLP